jgi:hypothetical protein
MCGTEINEWVQKKDIKAQKNKLKQKPSTNVEFAED